MPAVAFTKNPFAVNFLLPPFFFLKKRPIVLGLLAILSCLALACVSESKPETPVVQVPDRVSPAEVPVVQATPWDTGHFVAVNGTNLFCQVVGKGKPLLVLHGGPGMNFRYFLPQLTDLLQDSVQLVFFDQRVSGKSAFDVDSTHMRMADMVEDIEALRKHFGWKKVNLLGHSWGCVLAMFYAKKYPDRLESLVLMNGTGAELPAKWDGQEALKTRLGEAGYEELFYITQSPAFQKGAPGALDNYYRTMFRASFFQKSLADSLHLSFGEDYLTRARFLMYLYQDLQAYNLLPAMKRVRCKSLVLHGAYELTPAQEMEAVAKALPNGRFVLLPDCGHFAFLEAPATVRAELLKILYTSM